MLSKSGAMSPDPKFQKLTTEIESFKRRQQTMVEKIAKDKKVPQLIQLQSIKESPDKRKEKSRSSSHVSSSSDRNFTSSNISAITTPKLKGIPLEQAQMYGQYGIESVGLKKKTEKQHTKKAAA